MFDWLKHRRFPWYQTDQISCQSYTLLSYGQQHDQTRESLDSHQTPQDADDQTPEDADDSHANLKKSDVHHYWLLKAFGYFLFLLISFRWLTCELSNLRRSLNPTFGVAGIDGLADVISDAANETLGFQKIFALSAGTAWRIDGLRAAAELTGLRIEIPSLKRPSADEILKFQALAPEGKPRPGTGAASAWLSHRDLMQQVVDSRLTSAFIMEDDVDWDVALREKVMLPLAKGVRNYTNAPCDDKFSPYGNKWDLIWMGHCGEYSHQDMPYHAWADETMIPHDEYVGWAAVDMKNRPLPEGMRTTHPTTHTVCSFAFGVTAAAAQKILDNLRGIGEAYDLALASACHDKTLNCVTIHPEIFHHYLPPEKFGLLSEVDTENDGHEVEEVYPKEMGMTPNIRNSARCAALFHTTCQQLP